MARSKETFSKKEVRNKKEKKRKDKEARREAKKDQEKSSFEDMLAYVDENGNISDTPPDPTKKKEIKLENIKRRSFFVFNQTLKSVFPSGKISLSREV